MSLEEARADKSSDISNLEIWKSLSRDFASSEGYEKFPELFSRILFARGLTDKNQIETFFSAKMADLHDPFSMIGMKKAVDRLCDAFEKKEHLCIYADFDLDGTSGLALLKKALQDFGFSNLSHYQPKRLSEGYGFHASVVEELSHQGVSVIVTVDVGITAHEACEKARAVGVDVVVTDHHLPANTLPDAMVIVNPNQPDDQSKLGYLSGAGVALYLVRALAREMCNRGLLKPEQVNLKSLLDCFTIATVTDMVPLVGDNRILVKHGLQALAETKRPGLKHLLAELDLVGRPLSSQDVGIRFAPKLNALSRLELGVLPIDLYLVDSPTEAVVMVEKVLHNNSMRVQLQSDAETEAIAALANWPHADFVFVYSKNFHRGVVGLIATKLSQLFNRPSFVGSLGEDGQVVGSARVPNGSSVRLVDALDFCREHLERAGGHAAAAGFELHVSKTEVFKNTLVEYFQTQNLKPVESVEISFDADAHIDELNPTLMSWFDHLGPFGSGFSVPMLRLENVVVSQMRKLKGGHIKLTLRDGFKQDYIDAIVFSPSDEIQKNLAEDKMLDVLGELQWNYFAGKKSVQMLIRSVRESEALD